MSPANQKTKTLQHPLKPMHTVQISTERKQTNSYRNKTRLMAFAVTIFTIHSTELLTLTQTESLTQISYWKNDAFPLK